MTERAAAAFANRKSIRQGKIFCQRDCQRRVERVARRGCIARLHRESGRVNHRCRIGIEAAVLAEFQDHCRRSHRKHVFRERGRFFHGYASRQAAREECSASDSLGVRISTADNSSRDSSWAGAGSRIVFAPSRRASRKPPLQYREGFPTEIARISHCGSWRAILLRRRPEIRH